MFRVGKYRIRFQRPVLLSEDGPKRLNDTSCQVLDVESGDGIFSGVSRLHPNDKYDKVEGKKVALTKALIKNVIRDPITGKVIEIIWHLPKQTRMEIWEAFWRWVESWGLQSVKDKAENLNKKGFFSEKEEVQTQE